MPKMSNLSTVPPARAWMGDRPPTIRPCPWLARSPWWYRLPVIFYSSRKGHFLDLTEETVKENRHFWLNVRLFGLAYSFNRWENAWWRDAFLIHSALILTCFVPSSLFFAASHVGYSMILAFEVPWEPFEGEKSGAKSTCEMILVFFYCIIVRCSSAGSLKSGLTIEIFDCCSFWLYTEFVRPTIKLFSSPLHVPAQSVHPTVLPWRSYEIARTLGSRQRIWGVFAPLKSKILKKGVGIASSCNIKKFTWKKRKFVRKARINKRPPYRVCSIVCTILCNREGKGEEARKRIGKRDRSQKTLQGMRSLTQVGRLRLEISWDSWNILNNSSAGLHWLQYQIHYDI